MTQATDQRRDGDTRPFHHEDKLRLWPEPGEPLRFKPKHGEPFCLLEWVSQHCFRALPVLALMVATGSLVIQALILWKL